MSQVIASHGRLCVKARQYDEGNEVPDLNDGTWTEVGTTSVEDLTWNKMNPDGDVEWHAATARTFKTMGQAFVRLEATFKEFNLILADLYFGNGGRQERCRRMTTNYRKRFVRNRRRRKN